MMTKERIKVIGDAIDAALAAVGAEHDFKVGKRRIGWDDAGFKFSAEVVFTGANGDGEAVAWKRSAPEWGLPADGYGKTVVLRGVPYRLVKVLDRGTKFNVVGEAPNGRRFKFQVADVLAALVSVPKS